MRLHAMAALIGFVGLVALFACDSAFGSTEDDSCLEAWELENVQPQSPSYEESVSSSSYQGRVTIIALLAAT